MKRIFTPFLIGLGLMATLNVSAQTLTVKYNFSGNLGDSSGGSNHGTNNGIIYTNDIAGIPNSAASFNGTSSYVTLPNFIGSGTGAPLHNVAISVWFKTNGRQKPAGIAYGGAQAIGGSPVNYTPFMWIDSAGHLSSYFYAGQTWALTTGTDTVNDDKWHHAVFFYFMVPPTSEKQFLVVDGKLRDYYIGTKTGTPSYTNIYLGACNPRNIMGMPDAWTYFNGTMDNFNAYFMPNGPMSDSMLHCLDFLITAHPQNQTKSLGSSVTLSVSHTMFENDTVYTYVWKKNGTVVPGATDSVLTIASLSAADTGSYVCEATNNYHLTLTSNAGKVALVPTGINGLQIADAVNVYPSPAANTLNVSVANKVINEVAIYSIDGKLVKHIQQAGINTIDVSSLIPGAYSLKLSCGEEVFTSRFSKQ